MIWRGTGIQFPWDSPLWSSSPKVFLYLLPILSKEAWRCDLWPFLPSVGITDRDPFSPLSRFFGWKEAALSPRCSAMCGDVVSVCRIGSDLFIENKQKLRPLPLVRVLHLSSFDRFGQTLWPLSDSGSRDHARLGIVLISFYTLQMLIGFCKFITIGRGRRLHRWHGKAGLLLYTLTLAQIGMGIVRWKSLSFSVFSNSPLLLDQSKRKNRSHLKHRSAHSPGREQPDESHDLFNGCRHFLCVLGNHGDPRAFPRQPLFRSEHSGRLLDPIQDRVYRWGRNRGSWGGCHGGRRKKTSSVGKKIFLRPLSLFLLYPSGDLLCCTMQ